MEAVSGTNELAFLCACLREMGEPDSRGALVRALQTGVELQTDRLLNDVSVDLFQVGMLGEYFENIA